MTKKNIILKDILYWIVDNCDDTDAIEKINKATFPFTSRYAKYTKGTKQADTHNTDLEKSIDYELELSDWDEV